MGYLSLVALKPKGWHSIGFKFSIVLCLSAVLLTWPKLNFVHFSMLSTHILCYLLFHPLAVPPCNILPPNHIILPLELSPFQNRDVELGFTYTQVNILTVS